ncbi:M48 family metallopeptidase [Mariprofundus sp. KV]|uniref:M48 family metallopeptidase n=1 Tax=Mariprofundus sp. KV TaxID=2608715 RepID=UPI0015A291B9|nr:M48 family metallopeptidase [Mariprofundus sp. KV]NWF37387.1 M48 family metalloprotease [Mariprofundus sp. KV]
MNDFFGQQELAKRNTTLLVLLFCCAVILIVLAVYLAVTVGLFVSQMFVTEGEFFIRSLWDSERFLWVVGATVVVVASGSLYRTRQLKQGGGAAVAEMLGAQRMAPATDDPLLRRLSNVVEEMAIAAGLPVPPIYLLPQPGINAFAAGFGRSDAVIAVTNGAIELLTRDELQGVIAHEFSHILNGDIGLKMRLMGLLFGITLISDAGILLMTARHSSHYSSRERGSHPAIVVVGLLIFVVGTIGAVFADMIKRAVSRQREFLADAAAVQFTRNPAGIAGALKVIGGYKGGSRINHAATQQASHFFFGNAVKSWENKDWWATHPPLAERIRRLDPSFAGSFAHIDSASRSSVIMQEAISSLAGEGMSAVHTLNRDQVMQSIGQPDAAALQQSSLLLQQMPDRLRQFAHDPFTARAIVYGLLLDPDKAVRSLQLKALEKMADATVLRELLDMQAEVLSLDATLRIPLLELLMPALKSLSPPQYKTFRACTAALIKADNELSIFEYMLHRMLVRHLHPTFAKVKPVPTHFDVAADIDQEIACIISTLIGQGSHHDPEALFSSAISEIFAWQLELKPSEATCDLAAMDRALSKAEKATPEIKRRLVKACVTVVVADGKVRVNEFELLRAVCDALGAPMPQITLSSS